MCAQIGNRPAQAIALNVELGCRPVGYSGNKSLQNTDPHQDVAGITLAILDRCSATET